MSIVILSNINFTQEKPETPFPSPDPNKGQAWGYDFAKGEYRYASKASPGDYPAKASKTRAGRPSNGSNLKIYKLEDIKNLDDLDQYMHQNQRVIYIKQSMDEDQARDVLDYLGD